MAEAVTLASERQIAAVNWLEVVIRLDRKGDTVALSRFDELERLLDIEVVPTTFAHARLARTAHRRFGKGSGHPAQLNLADCMAYALAKESGRSYCWNCFPRKFPRACRRVGPRIWGGW
jgi:ribonuclease VapC